MDDTPNPVLTEALRLSLGVADMLRLLRDHHRQGQIAEARALLPTLFSDMAHLFYLWPLILVSCQESGPGDDLEARRLLLQALRAHGDQANAIGQDRLATLQTVLDRRRAGQDN
jgi:hypothetical protein